MSTGRKTGGRQKGTSNKTNSAFRARLQAYCTRHKVDPFYAMVKLLADTSTRQVVREDGATQTVPTVPLILQFQCAKELGGYLQPKLRSVEVTGDAEHPLRHLHELPQAQLDALITRLLHQTGLLRRADETLSPLGSEAGDPPTLSPTGELSLPSAGAV